MLGQLTGDSLGSLVEFQSPQQIRKDWPQGVRELQDGGTWNTLAGQPTDDSEMALLLARQLILDGKWTARGAASAYVRWFKTRPFDIGNTVQQALSGLSAEPDGEPLETAEFHANHESQANGALMRIAPLALFGAMGNLNAAVTAAMMDAALTHPHHVCRQANALFVHGIIAAIRDALTPQALYDSMVDWTRQLDADPVLVKAVRKAATGAPTDFTRQQGWLIIAFQNMLYQLLHAPDFESALVDTVMRGGDTDTNAAICGAFLGAVYGVEAIPKQWRDAVLSCRPDASDPRVYRPRPESLWPVDALELTEQLLVAGARQRPKAVEEPGLSG